MNKRISKVCKAVLTTGILAFGVGRGAHAQSDWQFRRFDIPIPGALDSECYAIRPDGRVLGGSYIGSDGQNHGWVANLNRKGEVSEVTAINFLGLGADFLKILGINSHGDFTGNYRLAGAPRNTRHGFLWSRGTFLTFDPPGSVFTQPYKINERGEIAGRYCTGPVGACDVGGLFTGNFHGFVRSRDGAFASIDFPGGTDTKAYKISESGQVLGSYTLVGSNHMFLLNDGVFTQFDYPGAYSTPAPTSNAGMNSRGDIVSQYCDGPCLPNSQHGFLRTRSGEFFRLDYPGGISTFPTDISRRGNTIIGNWGAPDDPKTIHCFILTRGEHGDNDNNDDCDGDCGDGKLPEHP